jgi:hypothetical protein
MRDPGNALDRGPAERYVSPPLALDGRRVSAVIVDADVPDGTALEVAVRVASSEAGLETAPWASAPTAPGVWVQYRASLASRTGARSPRLHSVSLELD